MRVEKCYFCSSPLWPGHGIQFVRNDCKIFKFCRSKCHKNFKRKKNPRKAKWTKAFRKANNKDLAVDPSFEFEQRRNVPLKYNRESWQKTIETMQKIDEIRRRREARHIMNRLKKGTEIEREQDVKDVERNMALIRSPAAGLLEQRALEEKVVEHMEDSEAESMEAEDE
ncbi:unnamed protein product [Notodromas monacha]|uniref:Probable ribosome biogenesis protein RLP24 n=1 Tax=Notodromas monacha TaxID=399045 RepID=A0A7R9G983_9CRUS|nr:unnamed protein product [Notodromas monacha]CAG0912920.1 unnamed protein product [Notodromas monacha]